MLFYKDNFATAVANIRDRFLLGPGEYRQIYGDLESDPLLASKVDTGHWQSLKGVPHTQTRELENVVFQLGIPQREDQWADYLSPNLPWAEDHFRERVCGEPLNPGVEYKNWPWYKGGVEDHKASGEFSHTYMERFWPRRAGQWSFRDDDGVKHEGIHPVHEGIRFEYGDLGNLIDLLIDEPHTRQAYLPIWFPEDLHAASVEHERVPCSLGYHFMLRGNRLHCFYPMRSVDFVRYLRDDLYMAGRLVQWVLDELKKVGKFSSDMREAQWNYVIPGNLTMHAVSLHIFEGDVPKLEREM